MVRRDARNAFFLSLPLTVVLAGAVFVLRGRASEKSDRVYKQADLIAKVLALVDSNYVERFDDDKSWQLVYDGLKASTGKLDRYSVFLTPEESRPFAEETHKNYVGVGFSALPGAPAITVDFLFAGSPAEKAGMVAGDRVVAVAGRPLDGLAMDEALALVKGEPGTTVRLSVRRADGTTSDVDLERSRISQPTVLDARLVDAERKVGYVYVEGFGDSTVGELTRRIRLMHVPEKWRAHHLEATQQTMPELRDRQVDAALAVLRGETPAQDF